MTAGIVLIGGLAIAPARAQTIGACPSSVTGAIDFPASSFICAQQDKLWLDFVDYGATTPGDTALPAGTVVHFDLSASYPNPDRHIVTVEPAGAGQFASGDTYSWGYDVVELAPGFKPITSASQDITFPGGSASLTSALTLLDVLGYNPDGSPIISVGGSLGSMNSSVSASLELPVGTVQGIRFIDTLTDIGSSTVVQSIANDVVQSPEPTSLALLCSGLIGLRLLARRKRN